MLLVLPAILLSFSSASAADPLQQVLGKVDQAAATFKGLTADVTMISYTDVISEKQEDRGTLIVKRPKPKDLRILYDIKEPDPQQISFYGHTAEIYKPKMNLVDIYDIDKKLGSQVNQYLSLGFGATSKELEQVYTIAYGGPEAIAGLKTTRIVLTPRKPDTATNLVKVELWISDDTGVAVQQKIYMRGGDYHLATYTNMKINPNIPESAANLNLPRNVKREYPQR